MDFRIVTPQPLAMRAGTIIDYRLTVRGVPLRWQTEISTWDPPRLFVDEQRRGPYRRWVHTHRFHDVAGGTAVEDEVEFQAPLGWAVEPLFVRRDVRAIFEYRQRAILEAFGADPRSPAAVTLG